MKRWDLVVLDQKIVEETFGECESFFDLEWGHVYRVEEAYSLMGAESSLLIQNEDYAAKFFRRATPAEIAASKIAA
ncbi:hypothetical protein AUJ77_02345 [Candidatus Nomurabacteria bacterium CG1_02_43_90]|uniref:Uncharacterized protein n=1 Tax=Candidatus Nomurabacteria bacterium CG1_02_43_90 TaxID=1805281 RepID=A0A1J4V0C7_9BACT|nr:MAG: hypothetical protein AUJ77_02345 [Candidatus Nomurabacteria bacterium CG1_02_43_90]